MKPRDLVAETIGGSLLHQVMRILDLTGTAEEEIAIAKKAAPRKAKVLHASFRLLVPTDPLRKSERLYRVHVRELLDRVCMRQDTRVGTDAEMVGVLADSSYLAPLNHEGQVLYEHFFRKLFPEDARKIEWSMSIEFLTAKMREPQMQDIERLARRKLYQDWRK